MHILNHINNLKYSGNLCKFLKYCFTCTIIYDTLSQSAMLETKGKIKYRVGKMYYCQALLIPFFIHKSI